MSPKEFFDLVVKMREAQKKYFSFRISENLNEAKRLEKKVDAEIKRVNEVIERKQSPELF